MSQTSELAPLLNRLLPVGSHLVIPHPDLADFYGVTPAHLFEVSRAFAADFCFVLEDGDEAAMADGHGSVRVFTEHGALLAGCLLNTPGALARAVTLTRACIARRRLDRPPDPRALADQDGKGRGRDGG